MSECFIRDQKPDVFTLTQFLIDGFCCDFGHLFLTFFTVFNLFGRLSLSFRFHHSISFNELISWKIEIFLAESMYVVQCQFQVCFFLIQNNAFIRLCKTHVFQSCQIMCLMCGFWQNGIDRKTSKQRVVAHRDNKLKPTNAYEKWIKWTNFLNFFTLIFILMEFFLLNQKAIIFFAKKSFNQHHFKFSS